MSAVIALISRRLFYFKERKKKKCLSAQRLQLESEKHTNRVGFHASDRLKMEKDEGRRLSVAKSNPPPPKKNG